MTTPPPDPARDETLAAWDKLFAEATPGPWEVKRRWSNECESIPKITCKPDTDRGCVWIADIIGAPNLGHKSTLPNAAFISAARIGWPAAVEEIRRLCRQADAAAREVERLHSWAGLISILDEHYPLDVFGSSTDIGARMVMLVREIDTLRAENAARRELCGEAAGVVEHCTKGGA